MELNIKKAFLSPFSEEKWYLKLIFPIAVAALSFAANIISKEHKLESLLLALVSIIPSIILTGFFAQFAHNEIKDELPLLPELKSKITQYLIYGLKLIGATLIYAFVFLLMASTITITLAVLSKFSGASKLTMAIIFTVLLVPISILIMAIMTLFQGIFSDNFNFEETLNIKRIWSLVFKAKAEIAIYLLLSLGLAIALGIISVILTVPKVTIFLVPFFIALEQLISMNLKAQVYKVAKSRLEQPSI